MSHKNIQEALGQAIRAKRTEIKLSQEALADIADIHRTYIGSVERGERNISIQNLVRIANALNVKTSFLIADAENRI